MTKHLLSLFLVSIVSAALCASAPANLISNGSFESPGVGFLEDPDFWTLDTSPGLPVGGYAGGYDGFGINVLDGNYILHPGGNGLTGGRYQDITTVIGKTYDVSMWFRNFAETPSVTGHLTVLVGQPGADVTVIDDIASSTSAYSSTDLVSHVQVTTSDGSWSEAAFQFTATGVATRLGVYSTPLTLSGDTASLDVDLVSVIPEPSAMVLLGLGCAALTATFRRRVLDR